MTIKLKHLVIPEQVLHGLFNHLVEESLLNEYLCLQFLKPVVLLFNSGCQEMVHPSWSTQDEPVVRDFPPIGSGNTGCVSDPGMYQHHTLLEAEGLATSTGWLNKKEHTQETLIFV